MRATLQWRTFYLGRRMSKSTARRARRTAAQWEVLLSEQSRSGLTQESFCRLRGLGYSTFGLWRARLRGKAAERVKRMSVTPHAQFIELPAWPQPAPVATAGSNRALHVELELGGGLVLRIGRR
jgi:hypothetical protein